MEDMGIGFMCDRRFDYRHECRNRALGHDCHPRPPDQTVIAFLGGILLGTGAAIAGGCVVGNIMSGLALMSVGNIIFAVTVLLANWATTYFYLMGGSLFDR